MEEAAALTTPFGSIKGKAACDKGRLHLKYSSADRSSRLLSYAFIMEHALIYLI